jgi:hypothetical protein
MNINDEVKLISLTNKAQLFIDGTSDGVFILNKKGCITRTNWRLLFSRSFINYRVKPKYFESNTS